MRNEHIPVSNPSAHQLTRVVASNVRAELGRARMSQSKTATELGISQQALSRRLRGYYPFDTDQLAQLAQLLGVSPASFLVDASVPA